MIQSDQAFSNRILYLLYGLLALVYLSGLFIPLMENDSAQHAAMAMHMHLKGDWLHLYRGLNEYLDKPHMHFWLAALSFEVFGIHDWSYRIPALLFTGLGAYSSYSLARYFYGSRAGHIASLVFLSSQAIILANHDVRTDAVLTGSSIFAVWQLVKYVDDKKLINALIGSVALGVAFSTKGLLAVFFVGSLLLCYVLYNRKWSSVFNWKVLAGGLAFLLACAPMLYAYYVQFDSFPDKVVNGQTNVSGIRFIFWDQSFNRMTGEGFEKGHADYFFFFHTMLWAFLPWSLITYFGLFEKTAEFVKIRFKYVPGLEFLTVGGFWLTLTIMNFSSSKLPHYMNSIFPVLAVFLAGYLIYLYKNERLSRIKVLLGIQYFLFIVGGLAVLTILFWVFPVSWMFLAVSLIMLGALIYYLATSIVSVSKIVISSVLFAVFVNFSLNTQFYPKLLEYQAGINVTRILSEENIDREDVYILEDGYSWSLNIYTRRETPSLNLEELSENKGKWVMVYDKDMPRLQEQNVKWDESYEVPHYRITMLSLDFLNPESRAEVLRKVYLLRLS